MSSPSSSLAATVSAAAALVVCGASFEVVAAAAATAANRFMRRVRLAADREGRAGGVSRGGLLHAVERSVTTVASLNRRPLYAERSIMAIIAIINMFYIPRQEKKRAKMPYN
jgi:hypothetical protein